MTYEQFRDAAFEAAAQMGCSDAETYYGQSTSFNANIREQQVEEYSVSTSRSVCLRVQYQGKNGYAATECFEEPEILALRALDNAKSIENDDEHPMQGKCAYQSVTLPPDPMADLDEKAKIELAMALERRVKELDPRVEQVINNLVISSKGLVRIDNTRGLEAKEQSAICAIYAVPVLKDGGEVHDGGAFRSGRGSLDIEGCAREAVENAARQFGAAPVTPGQYRAIIKNQAMADLLEAFSPMFSADRAQKGLSMLAGREGEAIAAPCVNIVDNPFYSEFPRAFDGEGTPSRVTRMVVKGKLTNLLHNLKTAKKAGVESTANGSRGSAAVVGVAPTNLYMEPGEADYEQLLRELGDGLVILDVTGLHAGVNAVTGEFSLSAKGLLVHGGVAARAVERITVAGDFTGLLRSIEKVGNDLRFGLPSDCYVGAPSVLCAAVAVSGE